MLEASWGSIVRPSQEEKEEEERRRRGGAEKGKRGGEEEEQLKILKMLISSLPFQVCPLHRHQFE